jgi:hypothetical protein
MLKSLIIAIASISLLAGVAFGDIQGFGKDITSILYKDSGGTVKNIYDVWYNGVKIWPSGVTPFDPSQLNPKLWFDVQDIDLPDGAAALSIPNKGEYTNSLVKAGNVSSTFRHNWINSYPAIDMSSNDCSFIHTGYPQAMLHGATGVTVVTVWRYRPVTNPLRQFWRIFENRSTPRYILQTSGALLGLDSIQGRSQYGSTSGEDGPRVDSPNPTNYLANINTWTHNITATGGNMNYWHNGIQLMTNLTFEGQNWALPYNIQDPFIFHLGALNNRSRSDVYFGEFLLFNRRLTDEEIGLIHTYLLAKWGFE